NNSPNFQSLQRSRWAWRKAIQGGWPNCQRGKMRTLEPSSQMLLMKRSSDKRRDNNLSATWKTWIGNTASAAPIVAREHTSKAYDLTAPTLISRQTQSRPNPSLGCAVFCKQFVRQISPRTVISCT